MKTTSLLLLLVASIASASVLEARATCNADDCLRAIRATRITQASADCSKFLGPVKATSTVFTILPASTVTTTIYSIYSNTPAKRDNAAEDLNVRDPAAILPRATGSIPTYASTCSGSVRYSSACSCIGVTAGPITASTTTTMTVTPVVVTDTSIIPVCNPAENYGLKYGSGSYGPPDGNQAKDLSGFAATAQKCCAVCFTTKGCAFFEYVPGIGMCYLTTFGGGPITDPYNSECPNGLASFDFVPGSNYNPPQNVFAEGPCAVPQA